MKLAHASTGGAIAALIAVSPALAETINVGTIVQTSPKPAIIYSGAYGSFITSSLVQNGQQRTVVTLDLHGIMQSAGLNWIERIEVLDGGGNSYFGSPGADIDYWKLEGFGSNVTVTHAYTGLNAVHINESSANLATRIDALDAMSGDQDSTVMHFVSLGANGLLATTFTTIGASGTPGGGDGGSGGGSGGSIPGQFGGGTPTESGGTLNLLQVLPGLKLHLAEAGLGESYSIRIVGSAVPAPAVAPLLSLLPLLTQRRRGGRRRVA